MAEENVNEVLGIEDATSQNSSMSYDTEAIVSPNNSAENALNSGHRSVGRNHSHCFLPVCTHYNESS